MDLPFFPGRKPDHPEPMAVFLPPHYEGVGEGLLRRLGGVGKCVVDPFGQSPALALEMARSGAAVLMASPNPVIRALLGLQADPPPAHLIRAVLDRLAQSVAFTSPGSSAGESESLEARIRGLYAGTCAFCGRESEADGFIWTREEQAEKFTIPAEEQPAAEEAPQEADGQEPKQPPKEEPRGFLPEAKKPTEEFRLTKRICHCPYCNHTVEEPATPADDERARQYQSQGLQFHLALERLAAPDDPDRTHAAEALSVYPPRSIYVLITLLIRLEALNLDSAERRCGDLLLLSALDAAHILRGYGHSLRARPRSLQPPAEYCEVNIWRVMERAAEGWAQPSQPVTLSRFLGGEALQPGTIAFFAGSARDLAPHLDKADPHAVITFLPRPNQAAWTLSAMWAGWLWGKRSTAPLGPVLRRRRYDWNWHMRALTASAAALGSHLRAGIPVLGMLGESEPEFFAAAVWSFQRAGFALRGRALRADTGTAQLLWNAPGPGAETALHAPKGYEPAFEVARLSSRQLISYRAEPTPWELLHAAAWTEAAARHLLPITAEDKKLETSFSRCQTRIREAVEKDPALLSAAREESETSHIWWLQGDELVGRPLADQVEMEIARILLEEGPLATEELDGRICAFFPGLLTPEARLVRACLESYGRLTEDGITWAIRPEDLPASREVELGIVRAALGDLGRKMGFAVEDGDAVYWKDFFGHRTHCFVVIATAMIGQYLLQPAYNPKISWIVLPGGRSPLAEYKLKRNIRLHQAVEGGWRFLKFRHIRHLLEEPNLGPDNINEWLGLDPLKAREEEEVPFF